MDTSFPVNIISTLFHKTIMVQWLILETPSGSRVIQKGHAPLLVRLANFGKITYENTQNATEVEKISAGMAYVTRDAVTIIVSQ